MIAIAMKSRRPLGIVFCIAAISVSLDTTSGSASAGSAEALAVFGRVEGPADTTLGTRLELVPYAGPFQRGELALRGRAEPEAVAGALTVEDGSFHLLAPEGGMWKLLLSRPGFVPMELPLAPLTSETDVPAVDLLEDYGLRVRVLDDNGTPIEGALILVTTVERVDPLIPWSPAWGPGRRLASTGPEGRARLPSARGESVRVEVRAPGHAGKVVEEAGRRSLEIRLTRGSESRVQVFDSGRRAAVGTLAWLDDQQLPAAQAAEDGVLRLALPRAGRTRLRLLSASADQLRTELSRKPAPPPEATLRLQLEAPTVLAGRVINGVTRNPLPDALVWIGRDFGGTVRTDALGRYRLPLGWESQGGLKGTATGYFTEMVRPAGELPAPVGGATLALQRKVQVAGVVVDSDGNPLSGVGVRARYDAAAMRMAPLATRTSGGLGRSRPGGRFRIDNLVPRTAYKVRFARDGMAPASLTITAPEPGLPTPDLRVVLGLGTVVRGRVVDSGRRPVPGARVDLVPAATESRSLVGRFQELRDPDPKLSHHAFANEEGSFEIRGVQSGRFNLAVTALRFSASRTPGIEIPAVRHGFDLGTVELEPGAKVSGHVFTQGGRPLEGARVSVVPADPLATFVSPAARREEEVTTSDGEGRFDLNDQREGDRIKLRVERAGYGPGEVAGVAVPPAVPLRVVLAPTHRLSGRVVDIDQVPIPGVALRALVPRPEIMAGMVVPMGALHEAESQGDGTFAFEDLPAGLVELTALAPGFATSELKMRLPLEGDQSELEIVMRAGSSLRGRVVSAEGEPVVGAEVGHDIPQPPDGMILRAPLAITDGDGGYTVECLEPGLLPLAATHPSFGRVAKALTLEPGDNHADFQFPPGLELRGRVTDAAGEGVGGASIRLRPRTGYSTPLQARSLDDGSFLFTGLKAGLFEVEAEKPEVGRTLSPVPVELRQEESASLTLELAPTATIRGHLLGLTTHELASVQLTVGSAGPGAGRVASDGSYEISGLSPGRWRVTASLPGTGRQAEGEEELAPGEQAATVDLDFREGLLLTGVVRRNGLPLAGAAIEAQRERGASSWSETDAAGEFRLEGLPAGRYHLQVADYRTELRDTRALVLEEDSRLAIDLAVEPVVGQAVDAETDLPLSEAAVLLTPADSGEGRSRATRQALTSADGRFRLEDVGLGRWNVLVRKLGYAPAQVEVSVAAGATAEIGPLRLESAALKARRGPGEPGAGTSER